MNKEFKIGDKVFDIQFGWGEVIQILPESLIYNVAVQFEKTKSLYVSDGKLHIDYKPSLFHTEYGPHIQPVSEFPKLIEVSSNGKTWHERVAIYIWKSKAMCLVNIDNMNYLNNHDGDITCWDYFREIQKTPEIVELTLEDISNGKGVGVPVELLRIKK